MAEVNWIEAIEQIVKSKKKESKKARASKRIIGIGIGIDSLCTYIICMLVSDSDFDYSI